MRSGPKAPLSDDERLTGVLGRVPIEPQTIPLSAARQAKNEEDALASPQAASSAHLGGSATTAVGVESSVTHCAFFLPAYRWMHGVMSVLLVSF